MYFDAVLDKNMQPIFNGTPQETREWLQLNISDNRIDSICIGKTMQLVTIKEYLNN